MRKNWSARSFAQSLTDEEHALYRDYFPLFAHDYQLEPEGAWAIWLLMGGRGSGKTRAGAEWVMEQVALGAARHVALIGETLADARDVMIEGVSGIRRAAMDRDERPRYIKSERMLRWSNGAQARVFSAEDPDSVRGHAFDLVWGDEFAKWRYAQEVLDTTLFALRVGERPRMLITTTPRNRPDLRRLLNEPGLVVTRARTLDNADHLSAEFLTRIVKRYEGTALGRQELDGELLEDAQGALWSRAMIEAARVRGAPALTRIVVAVDPPVSSGPAADACGIVAAGVGQDGRAYVLEDRSAHGLTPAAWAARAQALYHTLKADCLVVETNQGGELVRTVMAQIDASVPVREVHASRGKRARAEPVAMLYEQGRVAHVGALAELEDQMCNFTGTDPKSPDRLDALVWALTELMLTRDAVVRVRKV